MNNNKVLIVEFGSLMTLDVLLDTLLKEDIRTLIIKSNIMIPIDFVSQTYREKHFSVRHLYVFGCQILSCMLLNFLSPFLITITTDQTIILERLMYDSYQCKFIFCKLISVTLLFNNGGGGGGGSSILNLVESFVDNFPCLCQWNVPCIWAYNRLNCKTLELIEGHYRRDLLHVELNEFKQRHITMIITMHVRRLYGKEISHIIGKCVHAINSTCWLDTYWKTTKNTNKKAQYYYFKPNCSLYYKLKQMYDKMKRATTPLSHYYEKLQEYETEARNLLGERCFY
jgi:hypothetical protein